MSGTFDPATFLDVTLSEANDTRLVPVPEGVYPAVCGEPSTRTALGKADGREYVFLEIPLEIDSSSRTPAGDTVAEATGRDKNTVRYSTGLEFNSSGALDTSPGKNVGLGRLREAVGLNKKGEAFNIRMIQGRPLKVTVKHRMHEGDVFADAKMVAPL